VTGPKPVRDPVQEYLAFKNQQKQQPATDPVSAYLKLRGTPASGNLGEPPLMEVRSSPGMLQNALDAFPFATKGMAAIDAALPGSGDYEANLAARKSGLTQFRAAHPGQALASTIVGAAAPAVATMGGSAPTEAGLLAPKATLLAKMGKGAVAGAGYGALQGASQAQGSPEDYAREIALSSGFGAAGGAGGALLGSGIATLARKTGLPTYLSNTAASLAGKTAPGGTANRILTNIANTLGARGEASGLVGQYGAMDRAGGYVPEPMPNTVPTMAIDQAGPNTEKLAQTVAHGPPGPGQATMVRALQRRMGAMKPSITEAIQGGTGVGPGEGMQPLRDLVTANKAKANELFDAARAATKGQTIESPTFDAIRKTPIGQQAETYAIIEKANRMALQPVQVPAGPAPGFDQSQWNRVLDRLRANGENIPTVTSEEGLPDPELVHYMKQFVARQAKMGNPTDPMTTQAQGVLGVWNLLRKELPPEWRAADAATAKGFQLERGMDVGRGIFKTQVNPQVPARKAINTSLDAAVSSTGAANPEIQAATRAGVGMAAQTRAQGLGIGKNASPGKLFGGEANAQRMSLGFEDPEKAQQFQRLVDTWDRVQGQKERILSGSQTAGRAEAQAARAPDQATAGFFGNIVRGNFGSAVGTLKNQTGSAADRAFRVETDKQIANILTSPNPSALDDARLTALLRLRLGKASSRLLPRLGGSEAAAPR